MADVEALCWRASLRKSSKSASFWQTPPTPPKKYAEIFKLVRWCRLILQKWDAANLTFDFREIKKYIYLKKMMWFQKKLKSVAWMLTFHSVFHLIPVATSSARRSDTRVGWNVNYSPRCKQNNRITRKVRRDVWLIDTMAAATAQSSSRTIQWTSLSFSTDS